MNAVPMNPQLKGERPVWVAAAHSFSHSFCKQVFMSGAPLVVEDAWQHALVAANTAVSQMGVVAHVGSPHTRRRVAHRETSMERAITPRATAPT